MVIDVYLYGMTVLSTIHRLTGGDLQVDGYGEIAETYSCPGGEAMNGAMLLSGLGLETALGGPHWGSETREVLARYARRYGIDVSGISVDEGYPGVRDLVIVDDRHRTVLGWFERYFSDENRRWGEPDARAIEQCRVMAIDPFFGDSSTRAGSLARAAGKPYVVIDTPFEDALHAYAFATVVSREYRTRRYPGTSDEALLDHYADQGSGLTIFTAGKEAVLFKRRGGALGTHLPPRVAVRSTLGAGDAFRAGIVYGVYRGFDDRESVRFASGLAALACTRVPIGDNVPSLREVEAFLFAC